MATKEYKFDVMKEGLCYMSVCTNLSLRDVEQKRLMSGTTRGWSLSNDKKFADGAPNPCPCPERKGFRHFLFDC